MTRHHRRARPSTLRSPTTSLPPGHGTVEPSHAPSYTEHQHQPRPGPPTGQTRPRRGHRRSCQPHSDDRPAKTTEPAHATPRTANTAPGPATPANRDTQPGPCAHTPTRTPSSPDTTDTPPAARPRHGQQPRTHRQKQDTAIRWPRVNTHPPGPLPAERQLDEPGGVPRVTRTPPSSPSHQHVTKHHRRNHPTRSQAVKPPTALGTASLCLAIFAPVERPGSHRSIRASTVKGLVRGAGSGTHSPS